MYRFVGSIQIQVIYTFTPKKCRFSSHIFFSLFLFHFHWDITHGHWSYSFRIVILIYNHAIQFSHFAYIRIVAFQLSFGWKWRMSRIHIVLRYQSNSMVYTRNFQIFAQNKFGRNSLLWLSITFQGKKSIKYDCNFRQLSKYMYIHLCCYAFFKCLRLITEISIHL